MEARELRIGNWLRKKRSTESTFVVKGVLNSVSFFGGAPEHDSDDFDPHYEDCEPIPLTEEWLLKFGFTKDGWDYWNGPVYFELADCGNGEWVNSVNCHEYDHGQKIKHVHQLQNLYFALTGKELTLNNP